MIQFLLNTMFPAIGTIVLGAFGWIGVNFVGEPLKRFTQLRRDIHESLIFTANINAIVAKEVQYAAMDELRRYGAAISALWTSTSPLIKKWWKFRGYDLPSASAGLIGLSNSLSDESGNRAIKRDKIDKALKLPRDYTDEEIQGVIREMHRRSQGNR